MLWTGLIVLFLLVCGSAAFFHVLVVRPRELPPPEERARPPHEPEPPSAPSARPPFPVPFPRRPVAPAPPPSAPRFAPSTAPPLRVLTYRARTAPREPVVFVHGLLGFDTLSVGRRTHDYFRGLPKRLRAMGVDAHFPKLAPVSGIEVRAEELARFVRSLGQERVHLVAHSLGGMDARYALAKLGLADCVASLTTIGTPHRGTPLADVGAGAFGALRLRVPAMEDLTTARTAEFNERFRDVGGVDYGSVIGVARSVGSVPAPLAPAYLFLRKSAGPNDGLVTAASQSWGEIRAVIDADHWAQVGWSRHFDTFDFYAALMRELAMRSA